MKLDTKQESGDSLRVIQNLNDNVMAKVTGPLLSLDASGSVASTMTFSRWKGRNYVRQRVIPTYSNTALQAAIRDLVRDASLIWKSNGTDGVTTINTAYKTAYDAAAASQAISGFNLFMRIVTGKRIAA